MKLRYLLLCLSLVLLVSGCTKNDADPGLVAKRTEVPKKSESSQQLNMEIQWEKKTFSDVILSSNSAFIGTVLRQRKMPDMSQLELQMRVDKDLYGNLQDEIVYCYLSEISDGINTYKTGNQYLMITNAMNHQFYPHTLFFPVYDYCLDITNCMFLFSSEKLDYSDADALCMYVRDTFLKKKNPELIPTGADEGSWESAAFVAKIRLKNVLKEATELFYGTAYEAELIELIRGERQDLIVHDENLIFITIADGTAQKGDMIIVGFSAKYGAEAVYTQEGQETVTVED